ncbi:MAG: hypothetical protein WCG85_18500 [Polyangia bacterium]
MKRATFAAGLGLWMAALPAFAAPEITSDSNCPSAPDVVACLAGLLSGNGPMTSDAAHIRVQGGQMVVELAGESEPTASRILPAQGNCHARAQAAALVIAAWLDNMPTDPPEHAESVPVATLDTSNLHPALVVTDMAPPAPSRFLLGAAAFASIDDQGPGAALSFEAAWRNLVGRFGLATDLSFPLPREINVGQGKARWWRPVLALDLRAPLNQGTWILDAGAGPVFGLLLVAGNGFQQDRNDLAVSWGATAGFRLGHRNKSKWLYWTELRILLWPVAQHIREEVQGSVPRLADLPRIEVHLGLGCSFGAL